MRRRVAAILVLLALAAPAAASWWDGFAAPPAGQGLNGEARVLHVHDGDLHAAGIFNDAGGTEAWYVARWDSIAWHDLAVGTNHRIDALCTYDGMLVAGGRFTEAGGVPVKYVAAWDGLGWEPVGVPATWTWGYVISLTVHDGDLYAGGTGYVARWNGGGWQAITGAGFGGDVFALSSYDGELYAAGAFSAIVNPGGGAVTAANIARWDGAEWQTAGGGTDGTVYALELHGDDLVAGGVFHSPGDLVACWNGTSWYAPGGGLNGSYVIALDSWSGRLIAGGDFTGSSGVLMTRIGLLTGGDWSAMGDGVNDAVRAVAGMGDVVFAGGEFTYAGELPSQYMGRWDDPSVGVGGDTPSAGLVTLLPPFPNPANPRVTVPVRIDAAGPVRVAVYDLSGRLVRELWDGVMDAGVRELVWNGMGENGRPAPTGCYMVRAVSPVGTSGRVVALVR